MPAGQSATAVFKPGFTPLEQYGELASMRQGPWTDLYALAAVLFEMVTGAPPFLDRTLASVYAQLLTAEAPTASAVADRSIPPELDAVLARSLAKQREERFADVREFLDAVRTITHAENSAQKTREREPARAG